MKAWARYRYGSVTELQLVDVPAPDPGEDGALIEIRAASLNRSDWEALTGAPAYVRISGLRRPKHPLVGSDVAGRVVAIGPAHERFAIGDEILADILAAPGACAQYARIRRAPATRKPASMSFRDRRVDPPSGRDRLAGDPWQGRTRIPCPGQRAGGSTGVFAVQLAKLEGATVTAVDHGAKLPMLQSLGADRVIDHTVTDFTRTGDRYDLIIDVLGLRSAFAYRRALAPGGRASIVGGPVRKLLRLVVIGRALRRFGRKRVGMLLVDPNSEDLARITELVASGAIRPSIEVFTFDDVPEAMRRLGAGQISGKAVIVVPPAAEA